VNSYLFICWRGYYTVSHPRKARILSKSTDIKVSYKPVLLQMGFIYRPLQWKKRGIKG
jgi:hypothetical protein